MLINVQDDFYAPYLKSFLKKLITEVELDYGYVLDQLYELYAQFMTSFKVFSINSFLRNCAFIPSFFLLVMVG